MPNPSTTRVRSIVTDFTPEEIEHEEQALKTIKIVYLHVDQKRNGRGRGNVEPIGKISVGFQKVEHHITEFKKVEKCFAYLRDNPNVKIFLILSNGPGENNMSALKEHSQVGFIFQLDLPLPWIRVDESVASQSSHQFINRLTARHQFGHSEISRNTATRVSPMLSSEDFITDSRLFILYQLLMEILLRLPLTDNSRNDFIAWSLELYSSPEHKQAINGFPPELEPYRAIECYIDSSFVYRILSRTFAADDITLIYKIRYFICHLYRELKILHEETFETFGPKIWVYRGKKMTREEFNGLKQSIGKLVITKSFLSASLNREVALFFSGDRYVRAGNVAVIFRMIIDQTANKSKPYAFVGHESTMEDENEFILPPGMTFRNRDIKKIEDNLFEVELVHTSEEEQAQEELSNPLIHQVISQLSEVQVVEGNNQPTESQSASTTSKPTPVQENESSLPTSPPATGMKRLYAEITALRKSDICSGASPICIVDNTPFDNEEEHIDISEGRIIARIFPRSNIYNRSAYRIEIRFPPTYPLAAPQVRFLTPIYHPNVDRDGMICLKTFRQPETWTPQSTLTDIMKDVVDLIDQPDIDAALSFELGQEYMKNRAEFDRKALEMVKQHGLPRN